MARKVEAVTVGVGLVGEEKDVAIKSLKPNKWNPNRMTAEMRASLKQGLEADGWIRSQKLLVWGSDENGEVRNIIIDGEQRWRVAKAMGTFPVVPCVFLHGIDENTAKKLTIKMDQKRGEFDPTNLGELLRGLYEGVEVADYALEMGFDNATMQKYLDASQPGIPGAEPPVELGVARKYSLSLAFESSTPRDELKSLVEFLAKRDGKFTGDVVLTAMRAYTGPSALGGK